jgi:multidrug efflux pump subunit AcrA (membrane-fusion protein)
MENIMKRNLSIAITISLVLGLSAFISVTCTSPQTASEKKATEIRTGALQEKVTADGNLTMPHQVKLRFSTPGTVKTILVKEGDKVRAGTLLVKLEDTQQKLAIASALYDVELAMNELAERLYPSILGFPNYYPSTSVVLRIEQALEGVKQAATLVEQGQPKDAAGKLRLAQYDLEACNNTLKAALSTMDPNPPDKSANYVSDEVSSYSGTNIQDLIKLIEHNLGTLADIQSLLEKADHARVSSMLSIIHQDMKNTYSVAQKVCGQVVLLGISYPDASTSLDSLRAAQERLAELQSGVDNGSYNAVEFAKILRMAKHDLAMSDTILENNDLIIKHGLNLKMLRQHNLNLQKSRLALQQSKDELMKTEILAPFDGTVVFIGVKENDHLSAYDYSSITAVHLVDTQTVELDGVIDEIDIFKVKVGQKASITVDALTEQKLTGTVTFISPFATEKAGVVNYKITIKLDSTEIELRGGLTATATIMVDNK